MRCALARAAVLARVGFWTAAAAVTLARAAAAEPDWSPGWEEGLKEAAERACPIIMVAPFKGGTLKPGIFPEVFNDPDVIKLSELCVCFYADDRRYPKLDTVYAARFVRSSAGKYGTLQVIFCKTDGTEVEKLRLSGDAPKEKVVAGMRALLKDYPAAVPRPQYLPCKALLVRARVLHSLEAYGESVETYEQLARVKSELRFVKDAGNAAGLLREEAARKVEDAAKELSADDPQRRAEAMMKLHVYSRGMKGLDCHSRVRELLSQAQKDPGLRSAFNAAEKSARAFELVVKGEVAFLDGRYKDAARLYGRVEREFRDSRYIERAKERLKELSEKLAPAKEPEQATPCRCIGASDAVDKETDP